MRAWRHQAADERFGTPLTRPVRCSSPPCPQTSFGSPRKDMIGVTTRANNRNKIQRQTHPQSRLQHKNKWPKTAGQTNGAAAGQQQQDISRSKNPTRTCSRKGRSTVSATATTTTTRLPAHSLRARHLKVYVPHPLQPLAVSEPPPMLGELLQPSLCRYRRHRSPIIRVKVRSVCYSQEDNR